MMSFVQFIQNIWKIPSKVSFHNIVAILGTKIQILFKKEIYFWDIFYRLSNTVSLFGHGNLSKF